MMDYYFNYLSNKLSFYVFHDSLFFFLFFLTYLLIIEMYYLDTYAYNITFLNAT